MSCKFLAWSYVLPHAFFAEKQRNPELVFMLHRLAEDTDGGDLPFFWGAAFQKRQFGLQFGNALVALS
jgi:hypothetical protein